MRFLPRILFNDVPIGGRHIFKHVRPPEAQRNVGIHRIREDGYKNGLSKEESDSFVGLWLTGQLEYVEREDGRLGWYRPEEN